jgi:methane/ammonia monooxygenase subunit B
VMLVVGWVYMAAKYPVRLPQQTDRFAPDPISSGPMLASIKGLGATFDEPTDTLIINAEVTNLGSAPLTVKRYIMAMTTWVNGPQEELAAAGPSDYVGPLDVEPNTPIAPGETQKVTLKMKSGVFEEERLIPLHDPQQLIGGLIRVDDSAGRQQFITLKSVLVPTEFRPQYLP